MIVGVGIDLVDVARVERMLAARGDRVLARLCTEREKAYVKSRHGGAASFAARLAAKEAAFKALAGTEDARGIGWREIEVVSTDYGPPSLVLHGTALRRASDLGAVRVLLSLTHTATSAAAIVIVER
jgi:holo-[acyl-carrier protein] synthase